MCDSNIMICLQHGTILCFILVKSSSRKVLQYYCNCQQHREDQKGITGIPSRIQKSNTEEVDLERHEIAKRARKHLYSLPNKVAQSSDQNQ